ncbi:hypothetical protein NQ995_18085, partial [Acinetobacter baumannii]|nr:hypothetical protein [Acinetobacter baumannii]
AICANTSLLWPASCCDLFLTNLHEGRPPLKISLSNHLVFKTYFKASLLLNPPITKGLLKSRPFAVFQDLSNF